MMILILFLSKYVAVRSSFLFFVQFFSSCQNCGQCDDREEQACEKMASHTYNYDTIHGDLYSHWSWESVSNQNIHENVKGHIKTGSGFTQGGYCRSMTVHRFKRGKKGKQLQMPFFRRYLVKVPEGYPLEKAGPIFCAGFVLQTNYIFNISPSLSEFLDLPATIIVNLFFIIQVSQCTRRWATGAVLLGGRGWALLALEVLGRWGWVWWSWWWSWWW